MTDISKMGRMFRITPKSQAKFSISEILKEIGNKDQNLDKDEIRLFTAECRKYQLSAEDRNSVFKIVKEAMSNGNKIPTDETVWNTINGTPHKG